MSLRKTIGSFICAPFLRVPRKAFEHLKISFSVTGEDLVLDAILKGLKCSNPGFYVDVGANHPYRCSTTWRLKSRNWRGINIDASKQSIALFQKYRPEDINICSAVSDLPSNLYLVSNKRDPFGSGAYVTDSPPPEDPSARTEAVNVCSLASILETHLPRGVRIDVLNIDCEGHDLSVLRSNNWNKFRPLLILVEDTYNTPPSPIELFCNKAGYHQVAFTGLTRILVSDRHT
jgi:FkbM family methyltransferase